MTKYILFIGLLLCFSACQESLEEKAANEAKVYTRKNCPARLSPMVVIDSMTFDKPTHTFGYHYTLSGVMEEDCSRLAGEMREELLKGVRNMTAAKAYMDEGYNFRYVYHSKKSPEKILFETLFTEKDYK